MPMSIHWFRSQPTRLYMCTGTNGGSWSGGKKDETLFEGSFWAFDPSVPSLPGRLVHWSHWKNGLIHYCPSVFNRQVLTSRDSMRFFARIKWKKVRKDFSSGFAEFKIQQTLIWATFCRQIVLLERFFNFSGKLCRVQEETRVLAGVLHRLNQGGESGIGPF